MQNRPKTLVLVDGSSYLYRAFHALPALTNSKGFPTGAVYGMVNMLKRLMLDYKPDYMAVVFDAPGKTFRDEMYEAYKATRQEMPGDLIVQIEPICDIIKSLGIPLITIEGVEADDVIGTLAQHAMQETVKIIISTGDKDFAQLVTKDVTLINTMSNTILTPEGVCEKFGIPPERIIDYLALVGDTTDNIPGVPLVGPKTAAEWLVQYGSLENIIENAHKFSGKRGENLRQCLQQLPFVRELVTIRLDVPLPLDFKDLALQDPDKAQLISLYKEMEFKTWLLELLDEIKDDNQEKYADYKTITTAADLEQLMNALTAADTFTFETITDHKHYRHAGLVGFAFAIEPGLGIYLPFGHEGLISTQQLSKKLVLEKLKPLLENPSIKKIGQNLKFSIEVLAEENIFLQGAQFDTMIESYILESTSTTYDQATLALKYLGWRTTSFEDIAGKGNKQLNLHQLDVPAVSVFAAESADVTLRLHQLLWPRIHKEAGLKHIFEAIEMPLTLVLASMERQGVLIDAQKLIEQGKELSQHLATYEQQAYALAGKPFNMNSPKQLQEILFQTLQLPVLQKTPKGQPSTADQVLQELALEYELPRIIILHRSLSKLISTYTNRLPEQIDPRTSRIHTSYNQTGTTTGRLSSSDPNLQNIPIRSSEGRRIRQAFVAPPGHRIISADYSQIELRLMAHISGDENLLKAFNQNLDIHTATAAEVWGVALDAVTSDMRRNAKAINFGLIYGMSAFGLTRQLGIDRKEAQAYIDRYFSRYPKVKDYMDNTRLMAKKTGYVETLWGRRLYIPDINASQMARQKAAERAAINAPLQGSAADIIKMAMIDIDRWLTLDKIKAKMIMQVHDELVFEVEEEALELTQAKIVELMTQVIQISVPLQVSIGYGQNWDEAQSH